MSKLREIYKGDFSKRVKRFDDGGGVDYASYVGSPGQSAQYMFDSTPVTATDIAALTGAGSGTTASGGTTSGFGVDALPTSSGATATANLLSDAQLGNTSSSSSGSGSSSSGALSSLLKALGIGGGNTSAAGITALAGLLGAAGQYKQNSALMPTNNTAAASLANNTSGAVSGASASTGSGTQFGPSGGYNYSNYSGVPAGSAGLGYAPRTYTAPTIPNYYTYGQGPQASSFSPAAATPTAMKRGGHVKASTPQRFDVGGAAFSGAPNTGMMSPAQGMPPLPATGAPPTAPPAGMPPQAAPTTGGSNPTGTPSFGPGMPPAQRGQQQRPQVSSAAQAGQAAMHMPPMTRGGNMPQQIAPQPGSAAHPATMAGMPPVQAPTAPVSTANNNLMRQPISRAGGGSANSTTPGILQSGVPQNMSTVLQGVRKAGANSTRPYAGGGALSAVSRHVKGPGDGTSDDIPARLANGEYVMDAQTVSMLGNGDNGSGAKTLDKFRENIRQHKGAALAKGKMAPDAKNTEQYLPKGSK